ncbi:chorismate-binding protein, partial [Sphaerotilus sulfidivorans]
MFLPADPVPSSDHSAVFALLDEADAPAGEPRSRLLSGWLGEWRCDDPATLEAVWSGAQAQIAAGAHALLLADYEWGVRLAGAGTPGGWSDQAPGALRLLMFSRLQRLDTAGVAAWLAEAEGRAEPAPAAVLAPQPDDDADAYAAAIARIHALIRAGETYQVNHTLRLRGQAVGTPLALYRRLRALQPVPFGALLALPGDRWVLSCSPELFVRHEAGRLEARPMKGTAARRPDDAQADAAAAAWLAADIKNRAENLMIVDLLRNDLGRIARTGSVKVPALFRVEPYRTVFQMTSTVEAEPASGVDLPAVLRALFPCGSITGAPKHRTMQLIESLESSPRGLYTGAIGWVEAPAPDSDRRLGDFALSVALRSLELGAPVGPAPGQGG